MLESLVLEFPGLITDEEVNGADLIAGLVNRMYGDTDLVAHLRQIVSECAHEFGTRGGVCEECGEEI